jgi:hypothetical protein
MTVGELLAEAVTTSNAGEASAGLASRMTVNAAISRMLMFKRPPGESISPTIIEERRLA